jgi:hypothetical protein
LSKLKAVTGSPALAVPKGDNKITVFHYVVITDEPGAFPEFFPIGKKFQVVCTVLPGEITSKGIGALCRRADVR